MIRQVGNPSTHDPGLTHVSLPHDFAMRVDWPSAGNIAISSGGPRTSYSPPPSVSDFRDLGASNAVDEGVLYRTTLVPRSFAYCCFCQLPILAPTAPTPVFALCSRPLAPSLHAKRLDMDNRELIQHILRYGADALNESEPTGFHSAIFSATIRMGDQSLVVCLQHAH